MWHALVFVPVAENSTEDKSVTYRLKAEINNLSGTSYSGEPIKIVTQNNENIKYKEVPPKGKEENIPQKGLFSRTCAFGAQIVRKDTNTGFKAYISNNAEPTIADYNIDAVNILIKFDNGVTYSSKKNMYYASGKNYTGIVLRGDRVRQLIPKNIPIQMMVKHRLKHRKAVRPLKCI